MKILDRIDISGSMNLASSAKDTFTIGTPLENNDGNVDDLIVHANANFKNNVILGSSSVDTVVFSGVLSSSIIPAVSGVFSLGSNTKPFKELFVGSGSISIASPANGVSPTTISNNAGNLEISAGGIKLLGTGSFVATTGSFSYVSGNVTWVGDNSTQGTISASHFTGDGSGITNLHIPNGLILPGVGIEVDYNNGAYTISEAPLTYNYQQVLGATPPYNLTASNAAGSPSAFYVDADGHNTYDLNLPDANVNDGRVFTIKNITATNKNITITPSGSQTIDGASNYRLAQWHAITVQAVSSSMTGGRWFIISYYQN